MIGKWRLETRGDEREVIASSQWEAYDALRDEPYGSFGLLVVAVAPDGERFGCRTAHLFGRRWGRLDDARALISAACAGGLPDTTDLDLPPPDDGR